MPSRVVQSRVARSRQRAHGLEPLGVGVQHLAQRELEMGSQHERRRRRGGAHMCDPVGERVVEVEHVAGRRHERHAGDGTVAQSASRPRGPLSCPRARAREPIGERDAVGVIDHVPKASGRSELAGRDLGALGERLQLEPRHVRIDQREADERIEAAVRAGDEPFLADDLAQLNEPIRDQRVDVRCGWTSRRSRRGSPSDPPAAASPRTRATRARGGGWRPRRRSCPR